jgi:hypothetical protein
MGAFPECFDKLLDYYHWGRLFSWSYYQLFAEDIEQVLRELAYLQVIIGEVLL